MHERCQLEWNGCVMLQKDASGDTRGTVQIGEIGISAQGGEGGARGVNIEGLEEAA